MDIVEKIYDDGKLLLRTMDHPRLMGEKYYECKTWVDEFNRLKSSGIDSLSTTLVVPGVGVRTYKNIGYLINSDWVKNKASDFDVLARYIKSRRATAVNEVNVDVNLDGVVGLFINKGSITDQLLKHIYVIKRLLRQMVDVDYPIYLYDWRIGKLELLDLSKEQEEELISKLASNQISYWLDNSDKPVLISIDLPEKEK